MDLKFGRQYLMYIVTNLVMVEVISMNHHYFTLNFYEVKGVQSRTELRYICYCDDIGPGTTT